MKSYTGGHLGHHLEYLKTLKDERRSYIGSVAFRVNSTKNYQKMSNVRAAGLIIFLYTVYAQSG